jgi:hypothetical protein
MSKCLTSRDGFLHPSMRRVQLGMISHPTAVPEETETQILFLKMVKILIRTTTWIELLPGDLKS